MVKTTAMFMMLRSILLLSAACLLQALRGVQAVSKQGGEGGGGSAPKPFVFSLQQSCDDWVIFTWNATTPGGGPPSSPGGPPHFSSCEITYMDKHSQVAKLVMVAMRPQVRTIRLSTLNRSTRYAASMTCNETLTSNTIQFLTGHPCSAEEMKEHALKLRQQQQQHEHNDDDDDDDDDEVSQHPIKVTAASEHLSMMDVALGVFFAMFGLMIVTVFVYYVWKKHRHRQRIQRIFGQSHREPFLALHTPSDQSTISF